MPISDVNYIKSIGLWEASPPLTYSQGTKMVKCIKRKSLRLFYAKKTGLRALINTRHTVPNPLLPFIKLCLPETATRGSSVQINSYNVYQIQCELKKNLET